MVIMEELSEEWLTLEKVTDPQAKARARAAALRALSTVHGLAVPGMLNGSVHGDARDPNVMVRFDEDDGGITTEGGAPGQSSGATGGGIGGLPTSAGGSILVKFVDFDWSGEHGQSRYPLFMSRRVKWARGVEDQGVMMQQHDVDFLASYKEELPSFLAYTWKRDGLIQVTGQ